MSANNLQFAVRKPRTVRLVFVYFAAYFVFPKFFKAEMHLDICDFFPQICNKNLFLSSTMSLFEEIKCLNCINISVYY